MFRKFCRRFFKIVAICFFGWAMIWGLYSKEGRHWFLYDELSDACSDNSLWRVKLLVAMGADPVGISDYRAAREFQGCEYGSHLSIATQYQDCRILRYLLEKGANANAASGCEGCAISDAVNAHNPEAVKLLLEAGASPYYSKSWSIADHARTEGFQDIVEIAQPYLRRQVGH